MNKRAIIRCPFWIALAFSATAWSQPLRDVIQIGNQRYLRTQQVPRDIPGEAFLDFAIAADNDLCSYFYWRACCHEDYDFLRQFDGWAQPIHLSTSVNAMPGDQLSVATNGVVTWAVWNNGQRISARVFDRFGSALTGELNVNGGHQCVDNGECIRTDINNDFFAVVMNPEGPGNTVMDVQARLYTGDGTPITDLIPVTYSLDSEENPSIAVLSDGTMIIGYHIGRFSNFQPVVQRIDPDGNIGPQVPLTVGEQAVAVYLRAQADDSILVTYRLHPFGQGAFAQRIDRFGQPLGPRAPIDPLYEFAAANRHGSLALAGRTGPWQRVWVHMYDSASQPIGDRLDFTREPSLDQHDFVGATTPLALTDDGELWIAWLGAENMIGVESYLTGLRPFQPADMNLDNRVDNFDIDPFVLALSDPPAYAQQYNLPPDVVRFYGDCNADGAFDNFDIDAFIACLNNGGCE